MKISPKNNILLAQLNKNTETSDDLYMCSDDSGKNLVTCTVVSGNEVYGEGDTIIVGEYSLYKLMYKGSVYFFIDSEDVIGTIQENA